MRSRAPIRLLPARPGEHWILPIVNTKYVLAYALIAGFYFPGMSCGENHSDEEQIRHLLSSTFDRADSRVNADPVVIADSYAIAGWTQGEKGGRALLRRERGEWVVVACAGDSFKNAIALEASGVPKGDARRLAELQRIAEGGVSKERRRLFDSFGPVVGIEAHPASRH